MVAGQIRLGRSDHRLRLLDQCILQTLLLFDDRDRRFRAHDVGLRLLELCAVVVVDHLDQHVTGFDLLEVLRDDLAHIARHLRGKRCCVGLKVSVVRALPHGRPDPPVPLMGQEDDERGHQKQDEQPDAGGGPWESSALRP